MGSARLESLNGRGRKRRRGKGRSLALENSRRGRRGATFRRLLSRPLCPHPANSRESDATHPHSGPPAAAPGRSRSGHLGPRPASRLQPPGQSRPVRRVGEQWQRAPSCFSAVRKDVGFKYGMSGSCSEGWNCHQNSALCECPAKPDERLWSLPASA